MRKFKLALKVGIFLSILANGACRTNVSSDLDDEKDGMYTISFYKSVDFNPKCPQVPGTQGGIGPSEGNPLTKMICKDNFVEVPNVEKVQDLEAEDLTWFAGKGLNSRQAILDAGLQKCNGKCVKKEGSTYLINLPKCSSDGSPSEDNYCNGKTYTLTTQNGKSAKVYIQSICPKSHWKNQIKIAYGDDPHCLSQWHLDLEEETFGDKKNGLNLDRSVQATTKVKLAP